MQPIQDVPVTVVVANRNGAHLLDDCLGTLTQQTHRNIEIIVVDDGSVDDSIEVAKKYPTNVFQTTGGIGLANVYNLGASKAKSDFIFFVNNDMRFHPSCVSQLLNPLMMNDNAFATDPTQYNWDGTENIHAKTEMRRGQLIGTILPGFNITFTTPSLVMTEVPWGCAGCLMVRRLMFDLLAGFDRTFFLNWEDADICWRAWLRGWSTIYVPSAILWHRVGMSEDKHAHLVRGLIKPPSIDKLRAVSIEANRTRFVLKTMPISYIGIYGLSFMLRLGAHVALRHTENVDIMTAALNRIRRQLSDILQERRHIYRSRKVTSSALIARFTSHRTGGQ